MEKVVKVLNEMKKEKVIKDYAIGGGMGAMFYIEPVLTYDMDVFCILNDEGEKLNILSELYSWAKKKGYKSYKEHLIIENMPVQFIIAYNDLIKEAVVNALEKKIKGVRARVVSPEYLISIMLQTGRPKDFIRAEMILKQVKVDKKLVREISKKYGLEEKLDIFKGII